MSRVKIVRATDDSANIGGGLPSAISPLFEDDFESYDDEEIIAGAGNANFEWSGARWCRVSTMMSHTGTRSLRFRYDDIPEDSHVWGEMRFNLLNGPYTELWVEYYLYYPNGTEGIGSASMNHYDNPISTDNNKFFRLWGGGQGEYSGNNDKVGMSTTPLNGGPDGQIFFEYTTEEDGNGTGSGNGPGAQPWEDDLGRWIQVRMYYKHVSATAANDGHMTLWKDGEVVIDFPNVDQDYAEFPYWDSGYFFGADNSHIATQGGGDTIYIFVDDLKFYSSDPGWTR